MDSLSLLDTHITAKIKRLSEDEGTIDRYTANCFAAVVVHVVVAEFVPALIKVV